MSAILVTPQVLIDTSGRVSARAGEIDGTLGQLGSSVEALASEWQGQAQIRFRELYAQWQRSATELNRALIGIATLLSQAGTAYAENEQAVARAFTI